MEKLKLLAAVVVLDLGDHDSLDKAKEWITELRSGAENPNIVVAVCANKIDLKEKHVTEQEVQQ